MTALICRKLTKTNRHNMKNIYFLRHGQTKLNRKWVHQFTNTPLSSHGLRQAGKIARKLESIKIDTIISSPYDRAKETADIISGVLDLDVKTSESLMELRKPSTLQGRSWFSIKSLWVMGMQYFKAKNKDWHYSDEENLYEFYVRSQKALNEISSMSEKNILVVTHRGLMSSMLKHIKSNGIDTIEENRKGLWRNLEIGNCCYIKTIWSPASEGEETLKGTWKLDDKMICPN